MLRLGFVGASKAATSLANYFSQFDTIQITGFISKTQSSAEESARICQTNVLTDAELVKSSDIIIIGTNDGNIQNTARRFVPLIVKQQRTPTICHLSGALSSQIFSDIGISNCASMHPLMSFPSKMLPTIQISHCHFVIEGSDALLIKLLGLSGNSYSKIAAENKTAYHLACVLASSGILAILSWVQQILAESNLAKLDYQALVNGVIHNFFNHERDVAQVLTGPIVRGDIRTIENYFPLLTQDKQELLSRLITTLIPHTTLKEETRHALIAILQHYN